MNAVKISSLFLLLLLFIPAAVLSEQDRPEILKVGIYQNPPKVYIKNDGTPAGFIVEIMEEIADKESWEIEYVFDSWSENIRRLKHNEIHIMLDRDDSLQKPEFENASENNPGLSLIISIVEKQLKGTIRFVQDDENRCEISFTTEGYSERI